EVLSKPSIICTQGIPAEVNTKETRQIFSFQNADRNNTRYQGSLLDSGVTLKVNATHVGESFVTLEIEPEVRGLDRTVLLTPQTLQPAQTTRRAKTTVTMGDGETLVIGGLYTNTILTDRAKTPLLSDIPLLGALFTRSQSTKAKTELLFILTPTIVRKTADLRIITPPAELERLEEAARGESTGQDAGCGVPLCPAPAPVAPAVAPAPPTTPYAAPPPPPPPPAAAPVPANTPPAPVRARPPRDPNAPLPPPRVVSPPTR
ncbi:MAG: type II secretion system protein GspD, partial [Planctomycetota bacterium]